MIQISQNISPLVLKTMRGNAENSTIRDNELLNRSAAISGNKDVARAMRDTLTGENSLEVSAGNDTVTISEEARKLLRGGETTRGETEESGPRGGNAVIDAGGIVAKGTETASSSTDPVQDLRRQIQDVQKQISEAQERLSRVSGAGANAAKAPEAPATDEAADKNAADGETGTESSEAKVVQNEIDTLKMQLQTLQYQLMQMTRKGGSPAAIGTAGIGGAGTGEGGGMGERISVS